MPGKNRRNKKQDHSETSAVFRIKPVSDGRVQIKYKGSVTKDEKFGDEIVELDKVMHPEPDVFGKHAIPMEKIDSYEMVGRIYHSNIIGSYIVLKSNYPVFFLTVEYYRSIVRGSLFQIYLSVKMDDEDKKRINGSKNYNQYINLEFKGEWSLGIECDQELKDFWKEKLTPILREEGINMFHKDYAENADKQKMTDDQVVEWINEYIETEMKWYESIITKETPYAFKGLNKVKQYFLELSQDRRFTNLSKVALECRTINRRKEQHIDEEPYEIPEKTVNLENIRDNLIASNELIMSDE